MDYSRFVNLYFCVIFAVLSVFCGFVAPGRAGGVKPEAPHWPGWRGPNRDGKSSDTGLSALDKKTGKTIWKSKPFDEANYTSPLYVEFQKIPMVVVGTAGFAIRRQPLLIRR